MASIGLAANAPHTEERAVFTQLKPVRMSSNGEAEDSSVFEEVKPGVRVTESSVEMAQVCLGVQPGLQTFQPFQPYT